MNIAIFAVAAAVVARLFRLPVAPRSATAGGLPPLFHLSSGGTSHLLTQRFMPHSKKAAHGSTPGAASGVGD